MSARFERLLASVAVGLIGLSLGGACSGDDNPEITKHKVDAGGSGGTAGDGGKPDGSGGNGADDAGIDADVGDAPLSPIRLGIMPVAPSAGDAGPTPADEKLAQLDVIALGSRGVSEVLRWDRLFEAPTIPVASEWARLKNLSQLYQGSGRSLLVCLALVDRSLDARPTGSAASWNDSATQGALEALVDKVLATFGDELYAISFGNELDRYFGSQSNKNATELAALVEHGIDYLKKHPAKPPSLRIGATFSTKALTSGASASVKNIIDKSDVVVATYYPLDSSFAARAPSMVAQDLAGLLAAVEVDGAVPRPILLQAVGYPSAIESGSSPEQQKAFFQALFQSLTSRRERFPFVSVNGLNDQRASACASEAAAVGAAGNVAAISAFCSLGLRGPAQTDKAAMGSVLDALAAFSTP